MPTPPAKQASMSAGRKRLMPNTGSYETEIGRGKAAKVGKDSREVPSVHPEPGSQGGEVLIAGGGRNPAASAVAGAGVVRTAEGEVGEFAVGLLAVDGTAHDHVMVSPAVVAALAVSLKG